MIKLLSAAIIGMVLTFSVKAEILSVHCPLGCPGNPAGNDLIFGHVYSLSNNPTTKFADWVAYKVDVINFGPSPKRVSNKESLLDKSETLEKEDYKGAISSRLKADPGHLAPLASFTGSYHWPELNHLSNITPQHKDLNQGAWVKLENAVRNAVSYRKPLYVITGTLYDSNMGRLPNADETHKIPSAYFKIVYDKKGVAQAFLMEQTTPRDTHYCSKSVSLASINNKVSFELPKLEDSKVIASRLGC